MGVLGISDNFNVIDNLEKRVRSRYVRHRPSNILCRHFL